MDIILATRNKSKADQIRGLLSDLSHIKILSLDEAGIKGEAVEDGTTLEQNALKKARYAFEQSHGKPTLSEDTGFFIDALGGQPGIHAARWAGKISTEGIRDFTLEKMKNIPRAQRTARFETCAVFVWDHSSGMVFRGSVKGTILREPRCECQPNMPYSGIFVPDGEKMVWAQMTIEKENAISHRGQAFKKVRDALANLK